MEKKNNIEMIPIERLREHPDNPRKDKGDLTELTDSIRKKGIMQNLTVVPDTEGNGYLVLIGNRRYAAALAAGLTELPCRIESDISRNEQVAMMLEENIQRNDLTVLEQADGFQMMLDLGETVETVAEKTGFSRSTVRHRLNISKLDRDVLEKAMSEDAPFQLTLTDLIQLERIEDVEKRNEILKRAKSSGGLVADVEYYVQKQEKDRAAERIIRMLEDRFPGIVRIPGELQNYEVWREYELIERIPLKDLLPDELRTEPEDVAGEEIYSWRPRYEDAICIMRRKPEDTAEEEPSEEKLERRRREENRQKIREIVQRIKAKREGFVQNIVRGMITGPKKKEEESVKDDIWKAIMADGRGGDSFAAFDASDVYEYFSQEAYKRNAWELSGSELAEVKEAAEDMPVMYQMLICLERIAAAYNPLRWTGEYDENEGRIIMLCDGVLERWGWYYERQEREVIDGTSDLYEKEGEK